MHSKKDYIGVFDSGLGGISVLRELVKAMPQERFLYFGDSANAPYGQKPVEAVRQLTLDAAEHLFSRGVKALVVACNTATAAAIDILREQHPEEIIVGIEPALKVAADRFPTGQVGVMATEVTLHEEKFLHLAQLYPACTPSLPPVLWSWWRQERERARRVRPSFGGFWPLMWGSWMPWCWAAPTIPLPGVSSPGF